MGNSSAAYSTVNQQSPNDRSGGGESGESREAAKPNPATAAETLLKDNLKKFTDAIKTGAGAPESAAVDEKKLAAGDELWNSVGSFALKFLKGDADVKKEWKWDRTVLEDLVLDIGKDKEEFKLQADNIKKLKKGQPLDGAPLTDAELEDMKDKFSNSERVLPDNVIVKLLEVDEDLAELRYKIVPKLVSEEHFWIIYSNKVLDVAIAHIKAFTATVEASVPLANEQDAAQLS
eukprot:TRINITY_DN2801_c0_g1_i1.p2 TRINITY_DN2801_c0_g1~~TRINITY_DN2801_c0_g1_i1.p2  ORF type:complete len:233 (-),score=95.65 TRINITY_DN2801_c0_g1_i1:1155-1853(-)